MNRKNLKITLFSITFMVLLSTMVINSQQKNSAKTHFAKWGQDYPKTKEIIKYKSKRCQ